VNHEACSRAILILVSRELGSPYGSMAQERFEAARAIHGDRWLEPGEFSGAEEIIPEALDICNYAIMELCRGAMPRWQTKLVLEAVAGVVRAVTGEQWPVLPEGDDE